MNGAGGLLFQGNSKLLSQPLGIVQIGFNGFDLGKTTSGTMLTPNQNIKDILYQQSGTMKADQVRTGIDYTLKATFGKIKTGLLVQMMSGVKSTNVDPADDFGTIGKDLYQSMVDNESGPLKVVAVNSNGLPSDEDEDQLGFYIAVPNITGDLINWEADTQRNLSVEFSIFFYTFPTPHTYASNGEFGYWGDPIKSNVPAIVWPNVDAPYIVTAEATAATTVILTLSENATEIATVTTEEQIVVKVGNKYIVPTAAVYSTNTLTLTLPAASIAAGNTVAISVAALTWEDVDDTPNEVVSNLTVINSVA